MILTKSNEIKIETITMASAENLGNAVQEWLDEETIVEVLDIKYAIGIYKGAVCTWEYFSAMILYKEIK